MVKEIAQKNMKNAESEYEIGDTVKVFVKIIEGDKERTQGFEGVVIAEKGTGVSKTFTVRKIVQGIGVERIFPYHSPKVDKIKIVKKGKVRRAKLYYLRDRIGSKATKIADRLDQSLTKTAPAAAVAAPESK